MRFLLDGEKREQISFKYWVGFGLEKNWATYGSSKLYTPIFVFFREVIKLLIRKKRKMELQAASHFTKVRSVRFTMICFPIS